MFMRLRTGRRIEASRIGAHAAPGGMHVTPERGPRGRRKPLFMLALTVAVILLCLGLQPFPGARTASARGGSVTFIGHGYGHGVGLCMAGVYYRALRGEEYHQIIRTYYTGISFSRDSDDRVIRVLCRDGVVRQYTMREYLYRLQEEPDSWPQQGLRVLMVAARTYVLSCIARGKHAGDGYDICPYGSCCQAFNEQINPATRPNTVAAVNATAGEIITYNGQPVVAAYSSCCGGYTAGVDEAWGGNPASYPYLRPVPDDACAPDQNHDWKVTLSWAELEARLNSRAETAVGELYGFEILSRWTSGRVKQVRVNGSGGSKVVSGTLFASVVGLKTHFFYVASQNFDEYICIQNPREEDAHCEITYMLKGGGTVQGSCLVPAHSRRTVFVNDVVQNEEVSVRISSDREVVAERAMYFNFLGSERKGGHACMGVKEASTSWYFAEGYTSGAFDTFFTVQNPNPAEAHLTASFLGREGEVDELYYTLAPNSRMTIWMDQEPSLSDGEFTAELVCDRPVVAERAMYFGYGDRAGGSAAEGAPEPATRWLFAEGYTGGQFDTWLVLANPEQGDTPAKLTFMLPSGTTRELNVVVPARGRATVHVDELPGMGNTEFSTQVESVRPVMAERAMYFSYGGRKGGHDAIGIREYRKDWYFAEGYTAEDFDTWIPLVNPNGYAVEARLTFMLPDGSTRQLVVNIEPRSRFTVFVDSLPGMAQTEFSTRVEASGPLAAERVMYFLYRGRDGGSCAQGTDSPSRSWYFAEGYTGS
ncbi:MAG: SpoIID/LytB domain-containing protein [Actinobacteria bacterium]|nr:SpoIID/LytB domain-containing protein [Actinomycetota bacterium]